MAQNRESFRLKKLGFSEEDLLREQHLEDLYSDSKNQSRTEEQINAEFVSASRNDIIEAAKFDLNMLAGLAMPDVFSCSFPPVLLAVWNLLRQNISKIERSKEFPKLALGIPRGHGKTTIIKLFVLYCILFTNRKFILVISDTATKAQNIIADITDMLDESNILNLFGSWKVGLEKDTQELKKFGFRGRNITIAAIGAEGSMRGLNIKNERPDIMIFDDVQSKECSESAVQSGSLERWMIGTAMKAKSPHGCLYIFAGNMFPGPNSILKKLKTDRNWVKFISGAILSDGSSLWPELHSVETLIAELESDIAMGHPEIFLSEVMNDTDVSLNTKIDVNKIPVWKWGDDEIPQGKFIMIDPSQDKTYSDNTAIGYFEVYDQVPGLRDLVDKKLSPGEIIKHSLIMALRNNCRAICIENVASQSSLLYWFDKYCDDLGIKGMQFLEITPGGKSKNGRIVTMLGSLEAGEIFIHPSMTSQVFHQILNFNPMKRDNVDNVLDIIVYAPAIVAKYEYEICSMEEFLLLDTGAEVREDVHMF